MSGKADRVTIVDVARAAGTSVSSASVALRGENGVSEATRDRIVEAARRLGYQPNRRARLLRQQRSKLLGVTFSVDQTFHADLVHNLYRAVDNTGYDLVLSATTPARTDIEAIESLLRDRCEALILISPGIDEHQLANVRERASVVTVGSELRADLVDSVRADDRQGITDVVEHLVKAGHREIAYVEAPTGALNAKRRAGYVDAMTANGLADEVWVISGRPTEQSGVEIAGELLENGRLPTAILAHNDMIAFGLVLTLRSGGVAVPDDISIVGYDNTKMAGLSSVALTSVSQDAEQLSRTAVNRAVARIESPELPGEEFVVPARLITRGTTGEPNGSGSRRP